MNKRFDTLLDFKGWGNPINSIWFIGIEEAGDWSRKGFEESYKIRNISDNEYVEKCEKCLSESYQNRLEDYNSLAKRGFFDKTGHRNLYAFYDEIFSNLKKISNLGDSTNIFISNLYPLGAKNITQKIWEAELFNDYKFLFDLDEIYKEKNEYRKFVSDSRTNLFSGLVKESNPQVIIFNGLSYIFDFLKIFNSVHSSNIQVNYFNYPKRRFCVNSKEKFIIVNHISRFKYLIQEKETINSLSQILNL